MVNDSNNNTYEEARKQRLLENKKRFEDLGISNISKSLTELKKGEKSQKRQPKPTLSSITILEPRRSSRARNPVSSYCDGVDVELPPMQRRLKSDSSWASYLARPIDEVKSVDREERLHAIKCAEKLQSNLQSENPFCIKSMVRSHVYSCFWLGLPTWFCEAHLPKSTQNIDIVLENENGEEYDAVYISKRTGLSGGWRAFALEHKLDDGDALVFELVEPTRLKVYIVKASDGSDQVDKDPKEIPTKPIKKVENVTKSKKKVSPAQVSSRKRKYDCRDATLYVDDEECTGSKKTRRETPTNLKTKCNARTKSENEMKPRRVSARLRGHEQ